MKAQLFAAALLIVSTSAMAAAPRGEASQEAAQQEKKICRTERATGSLTRRTRICLTETQWRELNARTKRGLDDFVGGASGGCRAPNDPRAGTMCGG